MDRTVRQLSTHISKKVTDSLNSLYRDDLDRYISCWQDVSVVVKLGILEDEKFYDRIKDALIWKNTADKWTTIAKYLESNQAKIQDKILYTRDPAHASHFLDIYLQRGIEVLCADSPIDTYLMRFLEGKLTPVTFQRIDAGIDENILDKDKEKTILDASGKTEASHLADFIRTKLAEDNVKVEAKSLATADLPGFILIDENQRRMRDYLMSLDPKEASSRMHQIVQHTFVVNTNNSLISAIQKIDATDPELAEDMVKQAYELSLLSQREMDPASLNDFIQRNNRVLEKLTQLVAKK